MSRRALRISVSGKDRKSLDEQVRLQTLKKEPLHAVKDLAATAMADSSGAFTIPTLPAGQYIACAEATTPGLLDPCHWAESAPTFTVTAGKTTTGVNITMARGAVIPIHIDDPQSLLKPVAGPIDFDLQIHAVTAKGHHYNANIESSTATTRNHVITVPFGTPVTIQVLTGHFVVNDESGKPALAAGASVSTPSGASAATISYVVAGKSRATEPGACQQ